MPPTVTRSGIGQKFARDHLGTGRHRRREHHGLAILRHHLHDPAQLRQEAHVEQPVGLVDYHDFDFVELDDAALDKIDKPSGTRDQHLRALANRVDLMTLGLATNHSRAADVSVTSDQIELARSLRSKLSRRHDHQRGEMPRVLAMQPVYGRDQKGRGLAAAGFSRGNHVAPGKRNRDSSGLDRGRCMMTAVFD